MLLQVSLILSVFIFIYSKQQNNVDHFVYTWNKQIKNYTKLPHYRNNSKNLFQKSKKRAKLITFNTHIHVHRRDFINHKANGAKSISKIVETGKIDTINILNTNIYTEETS